MCGIVIFSLYLIQLDRKILRLVYIYIYIYTLLAVDNYKVYSIHDIIQRYN